MSITEYMSKIQKIQATGHSTEHSYRPALQFLFESIDKDLTALNEPKRVECGAPDFVIMRKDIPVGHCEAKDIGVDIKPTALKGANKKQFNRYKKALPNLVYTNGLNFRFYKHKTFINEISIGDYLLGIQPKPENYAALENQLKDFAAERLQTITSAQKLAEMMAGKAVLIKDILARALLEDKEKDSELIAQYNAFKEQLIQDLTIESFAEIYAETVAYGMFAARLHDDTPKDFSRSEALDLLPKSNPFLRSLFAYIAGPNLDERIRWIIDELANIFQATDLQKLFADFGTFTQRNDPFIHFYETFLAEFNPEKRKARGVYYTPEPVVNFIVRAVDDVLKTEFGLPMGLADTSKVTIDWDTGHILTKKDGTPRKDGAREIIKKEVHRVQILDPATGTGTFLSEAIKQIASQVKQVAPGNWSSYVENDLIPRVHGFELLMASYAMCHMKLDMVLTELGYQPTKEPPRLSVYLTNSLEEGEAANQALPFAQWLAREAREANTIKRDMPIMCIIGNPPYSGESANKGEWIMGLMEAYKKEPNSEEGLKEENFKALNDDYCKFIRFSEHMIEKNGEGVLGFVTNHAYLNNPTFRGMRWHLLNSFDKIFILDLHGNSRVQEQSPDGTKDKNVFDIMQGVAIVIAVSLKNSDVNLADVYHSDIWGTRKTKNDLLWGSRISNITWQKIKIHPYYCMFYPVNHQVLDIYDKGFSTKEFFSVGSTGFKSHRDHFAVSFDQEEMIQRCNSLRDEAISTKNLEENFSISNTRDWDLDEARNRIKVDTNWENSITRVAYRPFDNRTAYLSKVMMDFPRQELIQHGLNQKNLFLGIGRQGQAVGGKWALVNLSDHPMDTNLFRRGAVHVSPLYLYPTEQDLEQTIRINFNTDIHHSIIEAASSQRGVPDEIAIFDYIYGVLHCPAYREVYHEFLQIDFPRIPYPPSPDIFWEVSEKGTSLRKLHLMESEAIGEAPYPLQGEGETIVEKPAFELVSDTQGRVFINETQYFDNVPLISWEFYIGGYQPAQKWLTERKGRQLSFEDIQHYQKIIKILIETDCIMKTIEMPLN